MKTNDIDRQKTENLFTNTNRKAKSAKTIYEEKYGTLILEARLRMSSRQAATPS